MPSSDTFCEHAQIRRERTHELAEIEKTIDRFLALEEMIISNELSSSRAAEVMTDIPGFKRWFNAREQMRKTLGESPSS